MKSLACTVVLAALAAIGCCGPANLEATPSHAALSVATGTHRVSGSYSCRIPTGGTATFAVSTRAYLALTAAPNRWGMYLSADPNAVVGGVTLDLRDSWLLEANDNGAVVYSVPQDTIYVHRVVAGQPLEYGHDMAAPPYSIQFLPATAGHPLGQLMVAMYPQGWSDPLAGECAEPVGMYLQIES